MNTNEQDPDRYRAERLAARAEKYTAEVARLRAIAAAEPTYLAARRGRDTEPEGERP